MTAVASAAASVDCKINGIPVSKLVSSFEWKSFVNGGFIVRAEIIDPYFQLLGKIFEESGSGILPTARQYDKPTLIEFSLAWVDGASTPPRVALVSDIYASGSDATAGLFEVIAVDPVSYYINAGDCSGKAYRGKIGGEKGVIMQVLRDYIPDNIRSYSVRRVVDDTTQTEDALSIEVKESWTPSLRYPTSVEGDSGSFVLSYGGGERLPPRIIHSWELSANTFLSAVNLRLVTSGLSAVSGKYFDRIIDKDERIVHVRDENTENKVNPRLSADESFTKPSKTDRGWTHLHSVPEIYSAGDIGRDYSEYIDGRARQKYMDMLHMVMRAKARCVGQPRLYDSTELGRTKATIRWTKQGAGEVDPRFLDGDWLIYGWHHVFSNEEAWYTDIYLARLDWDAKAIG